MIGETEADEQNSPNFDEEESMGGSCESTPGSQHGTDLKNAKVTFKFLSGHIGLVTCVETDDRRIASAGEDGHIYLWEVGSGRLMHILRGHAEAVTGLAFLTAGDFGVERVPEEILVSASKDGTIRMWLLRGGKEFKTFETEDVITCMKVLGENRMIIATDNGKITVRRSDDCEMMDSVEAHPSSVVTLAVERNSNFVCSLGDASVYFKIWRFANERLKEVYNFATSSLRSGLHIERFCCIAMNRNIVYAGDNTSSIYIIHWKSGKISKIVRRQAENRGVDAIMAAEDLLVSSSFATKDSRAILHVRRIPSHEYMCSVECNMNLVLAICCLKTERLVKFVIGGSELAIMNFIPAPEVANEELVTQDSFRTTATMMYLPELSASQDEDAKDEEFQAPDDTPAAAWICTLL